MLTRIISSILCLLLLLSQVLILPGEASANTGTRKTFRLSAYYSPLPGQSFYAMGSYEAELRMNGNGTHGASGVAVYPGMLAAPKSYAFGTKIDLDGLGVGTVWDRGGAIVQAGERGQAYDRIDVWMGHGEEGLKRALTFGKRTVTGIIYEPNTGPTDSMNLANFPMLPGLGTKKTSESSPWSRSLYTGISGSDVHKLQEALQTLGYFKEAPTGNFGIQTESAVFAFQQVHKIVQSKNEYGAGVFGPSTQRKLEEVLRDPSKHTTPAPPEPSKEVVETGALHAPIVLGNLQKNTPLTFGVPKQHLQTLATHTILSENELLQYELRKRSYYHAPINGTFDSTTRDALIAFQLDAGIIEDKNAFGAGTFGPQTKLALTQEIIPELPKDIQVDVPQEHTQLEEINTPNTISNNDLPMMSPGDSGEYVQELQEDLQRMSLYSGALHGVYDEETTRAVLLYQLAHALITNPKEQGAGYFGPKTSVHFNEFRKTPAVIIGGRILQKTSLEFTLQAGAQSHLERLLELN